jgi:hypothetical protein
MQLSQRFRDFLWLAGGGVAFAVAYSFFDIGFGDATIRWPNTWRVGVAQPYVVSGLVLVVLSWLWYRGNAWAEVGILAWAPLALLAGAFWAEHVGANTVDVYFVGLVLVMGVVWAWAARRTIFMRHTRKRDG